MVSVATVVAIGVTEQGERTVLGAQTGASEDHQFWTSFLRQLVKRGLKGVRLVISDAHEASCSDREGAARGDLATLPSPLHAQRAVGGPKQAQDAVAAIVRTIFAQPDHASAMGQLHEVAKMLGAKFPQVAELLEDAAEDVLAHLHFPMEHRRRLHSTNHSSVSTRRSSAGRASSGSSRPETR